MKRKTGFFSWLIVFSGMTFLMSCTIPVPPGGEWDESVIEKYPTVSALLTRTEQAKQPASTSLFIKTPSPVSTRLPSPGQTIAWETKTLEINTDTSTPEKLVVELPCNIAQAGKPFDITIPDDTRLHPGEYFAKTWRFMNAGSCTWTQEYAVVWFSGDDLGLTTNQAFGKEVSPGETIEVTVEMFAPLTPGTYQSNWKIRDQQGELFGIGPQGNAPFWVRIVVIPVDTPTVTATIPLATPTSQIYMSGALILPKDQVLDLDSGLVAEENQEGDIVWRLDEQGRPVLAPSNEARIGIYGVNEPQINDCLNASLDIQPVLQDSLQDNIYLCYRTTQGLPGRLLVTRIDEEKSETDIEFLTWFVP